MNSYKNKEILMKMHNLISGENSNNITDVVNDYYHPEVSWNASTPFDKITSSSELVEKFYKPLLRAIPDLRKEVYIILEGKESINTEREWVLTSGNYIGTFKEDFIGIPANNKCVWMRYMEYNRMEDGKIVETYTLFDILDLMKQAGYEFLDALGSEINVPGPATLDGVFLTKPENNLTKNSFDVIYDLSWKSLDTFKDTGMGKMGIDSYFTKDFMWYGPTGIGSLKGIKGFEQNHQAPFLKALPDRRYPTIDKEGIFFSDGKYCTYMWWNHFKATHTGDDWLGLKATNNPLNMRCSDIYRIEGDKVEENWVMLDMVDILNQLGVDVFSELNNKVNL